MSERGEQRRCGALLQGKKTRCPSWTSDRSNDFCPRHKGERWRLVKAYKDAAERATALKPRAVTTKEQLYALYSVDQVAAAEVATTEYLEALREELKGRTTVSERFYANGEQDGHHIRIKILVNEEAVVAALLRDLGLRARTMRDRVPRQPLRPVAVNRRAAVQRVYEYGDRQYMPMDYGRRPYGQPGYDGGMPGRPGSPPGGMVLRWIFYAIIGYGVYKVANLMFLEALQVCQKIMAPFTGLVRPVTSGKLFSGVGEWAQTLRTIRTTVSEQTGKFAREKLEEGMLENARKGIVKCSASAWATLSQLATQGVEAASDTVAPSISDPGQGVKNVAERLTEAGGWIMERSAPIRASVSKFVEDGTKAAGDTVASSVRDPGQGVKNAVEGLTEARGWIMEHSGPMWKSFSQLVEDGAKAASEAVASSVGDKVKK